MKATHIVLFASIVGVTGRWARKQTIDTSMVIGGIILAMLITIMGSADEDFAEKFAWLILFAVLGTNAEDLLKALGVAATPGASTVTTATSGTNTAPGVPPKTGG